jgi:hypothetical protein
MADGAVVEENSTPDGPGREPLSVLWHLFAAPQTLLVVMGLLALALIVGALIPQPVLQGTAEPAAWPVAQPGLGAGGGGLIGALGSDQVYRSFGLRLLLIFTFLILFVRTAEAADQAWHVTRHAGWRYGSQPAWEAQTHRFQLSASVDYETARDRIRRFLGRHGYGWSDQGSHPEHAPVARRRPGVLWARPLGYAGLLVAGLGLVIVESWGWQEELWRPRPGESRSVGHGSPYVLRLKSFDLQMDEGGRLQGHRAQVTWLQDGAVVHEAEVKVGAPATYDGLTVRSVGFAPVVTMRAWDGQGNPLPLETAAQDFGIRTQVDVPFAWPEEQPLVFIPGQDYFLLLSFQPRCGQASPVLHVDLIREAGSEQVRVGSLTGSGELSFEGLRLDVALSYVPLLGVDHRPGMVLIVGGLALGLIALAANWVASPHVMWLILEPRSEDETGIQLISLPGVRARQKSAQIASRLQGVLADDG